MVETCGFRQDLYTYNKLPSLVFLRIGTFQMYSEYVHQYLCHLYLKNAFEYCISEVF